MTLFIRVGLIALICLSHFRSVRSETSIDAQFQAAVNQIGVVNREESIEAFRAILSRDSDYAPAYHALANLYLQINTVNGRQRAMRMIQKAIMIDPDNAVYRLTRGKIWWAQGFRFRALNQHEKVNQKHPENGAALDGMGMYWVYDFLALKDERLSLREYAQETKREAERVLRKSIQLDALNQNPYYLLGMLYFEDEAWEAFHTLMQELHAHYPHDKNVLLFCGLAEYQIGEYNKSHEFYERAYDAMSLEERELLEAIDLLKPTDDPTPRYAMVASDDRLARDVFWKSQDPLYLSDFNERKMEHFGRMAYSNLRFKRFSDDVEGWQTDMGKTYIKFGRYRHRRSGYEVPCGANARIGEIWYYETFKIVYCGDGGDRWSFGGGFAIGGGIPSASSATSAAASGISSGMSDVGQMFSRGFPSVPQDPDEASHHTFRKTAQRFVDPYLNRKYTLPYQVATFEERDSIRVELSYMIPKDRLKENAETGKVSFWDGMFLFDEQWQDVYNHRKSVTFTLPPPKPVQNTAARHRDDHLLVSRMVTVPQGNYLMAVELLDQTSGAIGVARHEKPFVSDSATFHLSDLLVGSDIQARHAFPESRDDLIITPNPVRTFSPAESIFIYLELYALTRDAFGKTQYEIAYTIGKPEVDALSPTLFASQSVIDTIGKTQIDLRQESDRDARIGQSQDGAGIDTDADRDIWGETKVYTSGGQVHHIAAEGLKIKRSPDGDITRTVTADYEGDREMDFTYLQIDIAQVPAGIYQLSVSARDKHTGQTDDKYVYFRIAE